MKIEDIKTVQALAIKLNELTEFSNAIPYVRFGNSVLLKIETTTRGQEECYVTLHPNHIIPLIREQIDSTKKHMRELGVTFPEDCIVEEDADT